jgi:U3 small nucleolar RNA-associated protein 12
MDISQDSKLIITSSADKNIKIWGLDFGDCHKSIFAHEESIMSVGFEKGMGNDGFGSTGKGSHLFWSIGKDGLVKYWDGDKVRLCAITSVQRIRADNVSLQFDLIQTLRGHHSEIWSLALSNFGDFVITGGGDRGIRVWERTDDPVSQPVIRRISSQVLMGIFQLFLEEEREREMEQTYESNLLTTLNKEDRAIGSGAGGADGDEQDANAGGADDKAAEADMVKKQTVESLMAGEKILEALELCENDSQVWRDYQESLEKAPAGVREGLLPPQRNPRLLAMSREGDPEDGITGAEYVRRVIEGLKGPGLEDALLVLPFDRVRTLVGCLDVWIKDQLSIPLASRILFFLLRTHHHQIVSTRHLRTILVSLRINLRDALRKEKDIMGYNLAGLKYVKRLDESERIAGVLEGEMDERRVKERIEEGVKKRKRVGVVS